MPKLLIPLIFKLLILSPFFMGSDHAHALDHSNEKWQIEQSVLLDDTQQLTIKDTVDLPFSTFTPGDKLPFSDTHVWIELKTTHLSESKEDLYLRLLPVLLTRVTLYKPSATESSVWDQFTYEANDLNQAIKIGSLKRGDKLYLQVESSIDFRLYLTLDTQESMTNLQRRIDVFLTISVTVMLFIAGMSIFQIVANLNWISLGSFLLSIALVSCWITMLGFLPVAFDINQNLAQHILPIFLCATIFVSISLWFSLANQLFQKGRWIRLSWIIVIMTGLILLCSFFDANLAIEALQLIFIAGRGFCIFILILQAFESRKKLTLFSEKLTFLILLVPMIKTPGMAFEFLSVFFFPENSEFMSIILIRALIPISFFTLTFWSYNQFTQKRIAGLNSQLKDANLNLERETQRLDQQRKFTAMITHELKNPLMASQMALSVIENRLDAQDPSKQRVRSISRSLQEIDDIIERCSEIDKFEQGYTPLHFEKTSFRSFLASIKSMHSSERIYSISRGLNGDLEFYTDTYYLKIILNNLITNALKYSSSESLIEFKVEKINSEDRSYLVFGITNEIGPDGVPDESKIFERYYRSESAKKQSGAGLGLWLSQSMAMALGSKIELHIEDHLIRFHFSIGV
jgi:two-component system, sensor histidine kinase LadS